jgi:signal transduction histidine kinase
MMDRYADLVRSYLLRGEEADLAAIGALREPLVADDVPIEALVGLHERAMLALKDRISTETFDDVVAKTSTCLTELLIAYSFADHKKRDLRERELRLDRERQRLEALGQMAGGVAHEFNNLLQPIMGMAELALEEAVPGSELTEQLGIIKDCAGQAATIVRGILTTVRQQSPAPQWLEFTALLRRGVQFVAAITPKDVALQLDIACGGERVLCDEAELAQVLLNLIRNAAHAMQGRGSVRISLRHVDGATIEAGAGPHLRLTIADDGAGMPPEVAARAFQPFFSTKPPTEGTGLGLSIVLAIVNNWGGTVEVDSAPGAGTRISILLPAAARAE